MLIEKVVFNFKEVGEKSFAEIKNECLCDFAYNLKEALTTKNESIRKFWVNSGIANYKIFNDNFGSKIRYNSKSIVFEETFHNELENPWSVRQTCMDVYGLEYVEGTENTSNYYRFKKSSYKRTCDTCYCETVSEKLPENISEENIRNFYNSFGVGEFPFITITIIRLGNKDHYFYDIHR